MLVNRHERETTILTVPYTHIAIMFPIFHTLHTFVDFLYSHTMFSATFAIGGITLNTMVNSLHKGGHILVGIRDRIIDSIFSKFQFGENIVIDLVSLITGNII